MIKKITMATICLLLCSCGWLESGKSNVNNSGYIHIAHGANFDMVLDSLKSYLSDLESFKSYANTKNYPNKIKSGKYKITQGETNKQLLNKLQLGLKEEVNVRIKNYPTLYHMAGEVSKKIEADSAQLVNHITQWGANKQYNAETVKQFFIPNTYRFYWDTTPEMFVDKMNKEYKKFWNQERLSLANKMNFTPLQVTILASIVQMEAPKADEQAKVAKAYLNRLKINKKLEADPTSVYAYKLQNGFGNSVPRVYEKHIKTDSEYNTYIIKGLPPAPICLPNNTAIDAVLKPAEHDFIYFCADPDRPGYHKFTSNYAEHERNADKYRKWLNQNGIK